MTVKSAFEDLSLTTLQAIAGCLQKLEYLARLRSKEGDYSHWGFGKVYGQTTANKALAFAHREIISKVLSTPLRTLLEDVEISNKGSSAGELEGYLGRLAVNSEALLPKDPGVGAGRHLSSVLHALQGLERNRLRNATRQAS
jgi:hypothetical protein